MANDLIEKYMMDLFEILIQETEVLFEFVIVL